MRCAAEIDPTFGELFGRNFEASQHLRRIEIDQQRALIEDEVAFEKAASAADLSAVHFDVVARPVSRRHAQLLQAERGRLADASSDFGEVSHPQSCTVEYQLPANLSLVEIEAATAGDPPHRLDTVRLAVIELDLVTEELVNADQGGGAKAQEADGIGKSFLRCALR